MLSNGEGKNRLNDNCEVRQKPKWKLVFLSTGEMTVDHLLASIGKQIKAGQQVRIIDLQADVGKGMGIFDETYEMNPADFADYLKRQSESCYGCISFDWLNELVNRQSEVSPFCQEIRREFHRDIPKGADGQVLRVASKFALLAAAGELAIQWKILDWQPGVCVKSCSQLFLKWLENRGGINAGEDLQAIARIRTFIQQFSESRFSPIESVLTTHINNRIGWIDNRKNTTEENVYCFYTAGWREVLHGLNADRAARALASAGYLLTDTDKLQRKVKLPDGTRPRMYCVKQDILND